MKSPLLSWCQLLGTIVAMSAATHTAAAQTVAFSCDFPGSNPSHYRLSVSADGHATYASDGRLSSNDPAPADAPADASTEFILSAATTARLFNLAKAAHYFEGNIDSKKKNIASTGEKTLTYRDAGKNNVASYNYSVVPAVQELTAQFQNLSAALEFGRRLGYEYRYQKLALAEEMDHMDGTTILKEIGSDLPAVAPILRIIADDPSVINPVRARAMRLLAHASAPPK